MSDTIPIQQPDSPLTDAACDRWLHLFESGARVTRWTELPIQTGDQAPSANLIDARSGQSKKLDEFWREKTALILFWRHFGCSCGRDRATRLKSELSTYRELNVNVVIIAQGEPERARVYIRANELPDDVNVLLDQDESTYRKFGILDCGPLEVLYDAPDEFLKKDMSAAQNLLDSRKALGRPLVDNPWLLPGEFVIEKGGKVIFGYRYQYCENYPDLMVLKAAIRTANGEFERF